MKLDPRLIVPVGVLLALGAVSWRNAQLSRHLTDLRNENQEWQRAAARAAGHHEASSSVAGPRAPRRGDDPREVESLRREVDDLRAMQTTLRAELEQTARKLERANQALETATLREAATGAAVASGLLMEPVSPPKGPRWSPEQLAGEPDTFQAADLPTAWASQHPDGGIEWLHLDYAQAVDMAEVRVHESFNPGAISRVAAMRPDGSEEVFWEGTMEAAADQVESVFEVPPGLRGSSIRIYLDTTRVPGWNEIDAVELVGRDGSRQWASTAQASSYYGQDHQLDSLTLERSLATPSFTGP